MEICPKFPSLRTKNSLANLITLINMILYCYLCILPNVICITVSLCHTNNLQHNPANLTSPATTNNMLHTTARPTPPPLAYSLQWERQGHFISFSLLACSWQSDISASFQKFKEVYSTTVTPINIFWDSMFRSFEGYYAHQLCKGPRQDFQQHSWETHKNCRNGITTTSNHKTDMQLRACFLSHKHTTVWVK